MSFAGVYEGETETRKQRGLRIAKFARRWRSRRKIKEEEAA